MTILAAYSQIVEAPQFSNKAVRERLMSEIARGVAAWGTRPGGWYFEPSRDWLMCIADTILAAFPQIAEAPPSGNEAVEAARSILARPQHHIMPEERIAATYILSLAAPAQSAVTARAMAEKLVSEWESGEYNVTRGELVRKISAAITARDARTEARIIELIRNARHIQNAAREQMIAAIRAGGGR